MDNASARMQAPILTTLCYIEHAGCYLMLLRNKKQHDLNEGKWVGVGGKFLPGETPDECLVREVREETGFELAAFEQRGLVHFRSDIWDDEEMYLYTARVQIDASNDALPPVPECDEGTFAWVPYSDMLQLPLWEGDHYFLEPLLAGQNDIEMTLTYEGDTLVRVEQRI